MKKAKYLLLLAPSLFLLTSCGKSTATDLISEADARKFIETYFTAASSEFTPPDDSKTKVVWNITKDNDDKDARTIICGYIGIEDEPEKLPASNFIGRSLEEGRGSQYIDENDEAEATVGHDAYVWMNEEVYSNYLRHSEQNTGGHYLTYKYWGAGLAIISNLQDLNHTETRYHYYDHNGRESIYQVVWNNGGLNFTVTINFQY